VNDEKGERFKTYLKHIYDFLKIQDDDQVSSQAAVSNKTQSKKQPKNNTSSVISLSSDLPELIVDKNLVDMEQIYQQMHLLFTNSNDTTQLMSTFTKFFSKCMIQLDDLSFNIDLSQQNGTARKSAAVGKKNGSALSLASTEDYSSADADEDDEEDEEDFDDDDDDEDDAELGNMIANSKKMLAKNEFTFGIPDGSDSEISDFEVNEDEEDEEEGEQEGDENEDEDEDEEGEDKEDDDEEDDGKPKKKKSNNFEDIDSDEVDEDLVDLYDEDDLGDEKEVLELDKPSKSFAQVDFDRDDFGIVDDNQLLNNKEGEEGGESKQQKNKSNKNAAPAAGKSRDLFDQNDDDEKEKNSENKANKSSFELRQEKVGLPNFCTDNIN
jgi:hypothetical protein